MLLTDNTTIMDYKHTIQVIGFDLDQTLYPKSREIDEAIQSYLYQKIAEHKKCSITEAKKLFKGLYKEGKGLSGKKTLATLGIPGGPELVQEGLERAKIEKFLKPQKTTISLLADLKKHYQKLDIITGNIDKNSVSDKLSKLNIPEETFQHVITAGDVGKSDGSSYNLWLSMYPKLKPHAFLYIGDRITSDCEIPRGLGIHAILINIESSDDKTMCLQLPSFEALRDYLL